MYSQALLREAIHTQNLEQVKRIIEEQPSLIHQRSEKRNGTPLFLIMRLFDDTRADDLLLFCMERGANILDQDDNKRTITFIVCAKGMLKCLSSIITFDPKALYHHDIIGHTPLFSAAHKNQIHLIKSIEIPPDLINICDELMGHSMLFCAANPGHDQLCCLLLKKGANPFIKDFCGQTILSYAFKTPRFAKKVRIMHQEFARMQKQDERRKGANNHPFEAQAREDETRREQAYQMKLLRKNEIRYATEKQQAEIFERYKQLKQKQIQKVNPNNSAIYSPNWHSIAIKIIDSCLDERASWWFQHTSQARELLGDEANERKDLIGLQLINLKLKHHVYRTAPEFLSDMGKIWENYPEGKGPNIQIAKYARELRQHFFKLLDTYCFFNLQ